MQRLRGGEDASSAAMRESLEEVIEESDRKESALSQQERVMLTNLLGFGELKVSDVDWCRCAPRSWRWTKTRSMAELVALFRDAKHSRLPVYRESLDDPTGLVHVKDVLALLEPDAAGGYRPAPSSHCQPQAADPVRAAVDAGARSSAQRCRPATPIWRW